MAAYSSNLNGSVLFTNSKLKHWARWRAELTQPIPSKRQRALQVGEFKVNSDPHDRGALAAHLGATARNAIEPPHLKRLA